MFIIRPTSCSVFACIYSHKTPLQGKCCPLIFVDEERASETLRRQSKFSQLLRDRASIQTKVCLTSRLFSVLAQVLSSPVSGDSLWGNPPLTVQDSEEVKVKYDGISFIEGENALQQ